MTSQKFLNMGKKRTLSDKQSTPSSLPSPEEIDKLVTDLVRFSIFSAGSKKPIKKADINEHVMKKFGNASTFHEVYNQASKILRETFGLDLVRLPSRDKIEKGPTRKKGVCNER